MPDRSKKMKAPLVEKWADMMTQTAEYAMSPRAVSHLPENDYFTSPACVRTPEPDFMDGVRHVSSTEYRNNFVRLLPTAQPA